MAHIVILGAGISGLPMALEMRNVARPADRITVVSSTATLQFSPSNPQVAMNLSQRSDVELPLAPLLQEKGIEFIPVGARRVHPEHNRVALLDDRWVDYDYLIIATGPRAAPDEIPGTGPGGYVHSICGIDDAALSGRDWQAFCADPGPVVIGVVQRASLFIPAYEFALLADADLRRRGLRERAPITFVTPEPYIGHLGMGGVGDSRAAIETALLKRGIQWLCNARVTEVTQGAMRVMEVDEQGREKKPHEFSFKYSMLLPAFRGIDAVADIDGLSNPRGFVIVDAQQRNPTYRNVFSVGASIAYPSIESTPVPLGTPKSGFMIKPMVATAAANIRALLEGREPDQTTAWHASDLTDFAEVGASFLNLLAAQPRAASPLYDRSVQEAG